MPGSPHESPHRTSDPGDQLRDQPGNQASGAALMQQNKLQLSDQTSLGLNPTLPSHWVALGE